MSTKSHIACPALSGIVNFIPTFLYEIKHKFFASAFLFTSHCNSVKVGPL